MSRPDRISPYVSLRWKVIAVLSIVLLLSSVAIIVVTEKHISGSFTELQDRQLRYQFNNWQSLLSDGEETLRQLATFIPLLETGSRKPGGLEHRIGNIIRQHADLLNLEWDIQTIAFYDAGGQLKQAWPTPPASPAAQAWADKARKTQDPVSGIDCSPSCIQYVAVPLLSGGESTGGTLLLGRSIAGSVISFARLSGSEIAILRPVDPSSSSRLAPISRVKRWGQAIPAISHPETTRPLLQSLAGRYALKELRERNLMFHQGDRWLRVSLKTDSAHAFSYLLMMDVSQTVERMDQARTLIVGIGLTAHLATTLLLARLLQGPLSRLMQLIAILPLIGEHKHDAAHQRLASSGHSLTGRDEIDTVTGAINDLNDELQAAEKARSAAELQLVWLADHDPLTGLPNRRRFQEDFGRALQQAVRHGHSGALLYFDVDDFKAVNDLSGHQAGDELLRRIALTINGAIRSTDLFARLGGDEFAIIIPTCEQAEAITLAEKLLETLRQIEFTTENRRHAVSCSIGIALFPQHGDDVKVLMANADISMYQAKRMGQGRWHLFSPKDEYREILSTRTFWRRRIAEALEQDGFLLYYQPIIDIRSNRIARHKVLIRMRDGDELIYPDRFIPIAESTGQIHDIDRWVIRQAVSWLHANPDQRLSVNLSGNVVDDPDLSNWLTQLFGEYPIDPQHLVFEITETAAVENMDAAIALMHEMHSLGCGFALDDFGSGFASYQYLKRLPVDVVKIDGAFIRNLVDDTADQLFVKALADVAHGLGKRTVAEFVEDGETLALLREYGIHYAQGCHIGRPAPSIDTGETD